MNVAVAAAAGTVDAVTSSGTAAGAGSWSEAFPLSATPSVTRPRES